jgi:phosphoribosylformylglycinamidine synthase
LGASRWLKVCHGRKIGAVPRLDFELELAVQNTVRDLIRSGVVQSAHDCSEGGLAVALAECCFNPNQLLGAEVVAQLSNFPADEERNLEPCATLFNEAQSRIIISVDPQQLENVRGRLREVPFTILGTVGGDDLRIRVSDHDFRWPIAELHDLWFNSIRRIMESDASAS